MGSFMPFKDLREFMARLDELGELHRVEVEVSPELEISAITNRLCKLPDGGPALLFTNVAGFSFPVATNLFGSAARMAAMLEHPSLDSFGNWLQELFKKLSGNSAKEKLATLIESDFGKKFTPVRTINAPFFEVLEDTPDLRRFPALKNWPGDGIPSHQGRFLTLPLVITADPEYKQLNCGMYRAALLSRDQVAVNWSPQSGGASHMAQWHAKGETMPVVIALGGDPMVTYCATMPLPPSVNEFWFAGLLRGEPVQLAQCLTSGLLVPA